MRSIHAFTGRPGNYRIRVSPCYQSAPLIRIFDSRFDFQQGPPGPGRYGADRHPLSFASRSERGRPTKPLAGRGEIGSEPLERAWVFSTLKAGFADIEKPDQTSPGKLLPVNLNFGLKTMNSASTFAVVAMQ